MGVLCEIKYLGQVQWEMLLEMGWGMSPPDPPQKWCVLSDLARTLQHADPGGYWKSDRMRGCLRAAVEPDREHEREHEREPSTSVS